MSETTTAPTPRETGAEKCPIIEFGEPCILAAGHAGGCVSPINARIGAEIRACAHLWEDLPDQRGILKSVCQKCGACSPLTAAERSDSLFALVHDLCDMSREESWAKVHVDVLKRIRDRIRPDAASASVTEAMVEAAYRVMRDEYHDRALISPCSVRMSLEAALAAAPVPSASVTEVPRADLPKLDQPPESPGWRGDATVSAFRARLEVRIRETVDQVARVAGHAPGAKVNLKGFDSFLDCLCDAAAGAALAAAPRDAGREEDEMDIALATKAMAEDGGRDWDEVKASLRAARRGATG